MDPGFGGIFRDLVLGHVYLQTIPDPAGAALGQQPIQRLATLAEGVITAIPKPDHPIFQGVEIRMLVGKILGEGLKIVGHVAGTMGRSDHQQDGIRLRQHLGQAGRVVDPGLVPACSSRLAT